MPCRATQDGWVTVHSFDKTWSTGEGNGRPLKYSCLENTMNSMKRQKDMTLKDELPRSVGAQYTTGNQWRNNSRENEETEPKQKTMPSCGCDVMEVKSSAVKNNKRTIWHWRRQWHPTPILLPGKSHGQRSLVGCSPMGSQRVRHN